MEVYISNKFFCLNNFLFCYFVSVMGVSIKYLKYVAGKLLFKLTLNPWSRKTCTAKFSGLLCGNSASSTSVRAEASLYGPIRQYWSPISSVDTKALDLITVYIPPTENVMCINCYKLTDWQIHFVPLNIPLLAASHATSKFHRFSCCAEYPRSINSNKSLLLSIR